MAKGKADAAAVGLSAPITVFCQESNVLLTMRT